MPEVVDTIESVEVLIGWHWWTQLFGLTQILSGQQDVGPVHLDPPHWSHNDMPPLEHVDQPVEVLLVVVGTVVDGGCVIVVGSLYSHVNKYLGRAWEPPISDPQSRRQIALGGISSLLGAVLIVPSLPRRYETQLGERV
jgi:hypothetical protein